MRDVELFQKTMGLHPPWYVERTGSDAEGRRLDLYIDFGRGTRSACPELGAGGCPAYDTTTKTWRHLNSFQHEAYPEGVWEILQGHVPGVPEGAKEHFSRLPVPPLTASTR